MRARHPLGRNAAPGESCHVRAPVPAAGLRTAASRARRCAAAARGAVARWVNVVLVLTLLASCGASNDGSHQQVDTSQVADEVVQQLRGDATTGAGGAIATREDVRQLCALLARVAGKQGVDAAAVVRTEAPSACRDGVAEAAP